MEGRSPPPRNDRAAKLFRRGSSKALLSQGYGPCALHKWGTLHKEVQKSNNTSEKITSQIKKHALISEWKWLMSHSQNLAFVLMYYVIVSKKFKKSLIFDETSIRYAARGLERVMGGPIGPLSTVSPLIWTPQWTKSAIMIAFLSKKWQLNWPLM